MSGFASRDPVHELTGQTQHLALRLGELGEGKGEPRVAIGHIRDEGSAPRRGDVEDLMAAVRLVPGTRGEPVSFKFCEHRVSDCGR